MNNKVQQRLERLPTTAKILDVGGWFIPCPLATHVVDIMPWETRGAKLQLNPLPGERFTKETWFQVDCLNPSIRDYLLRTVRSTFPFARTHSKT